MELWGDDWVKRGKFRYLRELQEGEYWGQDLALNGITILDCHLQLPGSKGLSTGFVAVIVEKGFDLPGWVNTTNATWKIKRDIELR